MLVHSKQFLINLQRQLILFQSIAPGNRSVTFPAFLNEGAQILKCFLGFAMTELAQHARRAAGTKLALSGAHTDASTATKIGQTMNMKLVDGELQLDNDNIFALTDKSRI